MPVQAPAGCPGAARAAVISESPETTERLGAAMGARLEPGDVVALLGELGAGKTVFVRGVAAGLGIDPDVVTSPTFTLVHAYGGAGTRPPLFHLDLYRIQHPEAVEALGWDEVIGSRGVAVVEWGGRAGAWLPGDRLEVTIEGAGEATRRIAVAARGERSRDRLRALLGAPPWGQRGLRARRAGRAARRPGGEEPWRDA